jgi:hypothetical protein
MSTGDRRWKQTPWCPRHVPALGEAQVGAAAGRACNSCRALRRPERPVAALQAAMRGTRPPAARRTTRRAPPSAPPTRPRRRRRALGAAARAARRWGAARARPGGATRPTTLARQAASRPRGPPAASLRSARSSSAAAAAAAGSRRADPQHVSDQSCLLHALGCCTELFVWTSSAHHLIPLPNDSPYLAGCACCTIPGGQRGRRRGARAAHAAAGRPAGAAAAAAHARGRRAQPLGLPCVPPVHALLSSITK